MTWAPARIDMRPVIRDARELCERFAFGVPEPWKSEADFFAKQGPEVTLHAVGEEGMIAVIFIAMTRCDECRAEGALAAFRNDDFLGTYQMGRNGTYGSEFKPA